MIQEHFLISHEGEDVQAARDNEASCYYLADDDPLF